MMMIAAKRFPKVISPINVESRRVFPVRSASVLLSIHISPMSMVKVVSLSIPGMLKNAEVLRDS